MTSTTFNVPSTIIHGGGARKAVAEQAKQLGAHRILLVTDDGMVKLGVAGQIRHCLLYTSPSPRDGLLSRMPSSA